MGGGCLCVIKYSNRRVRGRSLSSATRKEGFAEGLAEERVYAGRSTPPALDVGVRGRQNSPNKMLIPVCST